MRSREEFDQFKVHARCRDFGKVSSWIFPIGQGEISLNGKGKSFPYEREKCFQFERRYLPIRKGRNWRDKNLIGRKHFLLVRKNISSWEGEHFPLRRGNVTPGKGDIFL